ncbi:MAG TPA: M91 family zinc metallopeptidase [Rhodanobacteraceae bacterium]|nr:M91 family zinc metallopeptidase [Rhodanobacteraceae bacterium]
MSASIESNAGNQVSGEGYWNYQPSATEIAKAADLEAKRADPSSDTSTIIDGNATNAGQRTTKQTTDGKTIAVDPIESNRNVTIERERTLADAGGGQQYVSSDQLVFTTGNSDDNVQVARNSDGSLNVSVNGESYKVEMAQDQALTLRTGGGNDTIDVASDVKVNIIADGGDGNDSITTGAGDDKVDGGAGNDTIKTGAGSDDVFGGSGVDTIDAGDGNDVVYGGDGDDMLAGAAGDDYVEGGAGKDRIDGGTGHDMLSGGIGDDTIEGGAGDDVVYDGQGSDTVANAGGRDTIYAQTATDKASAANGASNDVVNVDLTGTPGSKGLRIEGSPEFVQRVSADIEMLRSSPTGRQMLSEYDKAAANGNTVTIRELQNEDNGFTQSQGGELSTRGRPSAGSDATIVYNPSFHMDAFPAPVGVLYHEMSHAYNAVTGTFQPGTYNGPDGQDRSAGVPNAERQAVGLDNTGVPYDFDGNSATAKTTANPPALTENGLRKELGLPLRMHYAL